MKKVAYNPMEEIRELENRRGPLLVHQLAAALSEMDPHTPIYLKTDKGVPGAFVSIGEGTAGGLVDGRPATFPIVLLMNYDGAVDMAQSQPVGGD